MVEIDDFLFSDELFEKKFICDLDSCKGGCCVEGDAGAPLSEEEVILVRDNYPLVKDQMTYAGIAEVERVGTHEIDDDFEMVTPTINEGLCVYGYEDEKGIVKCSFEKNFFEGKSDFRKPISCHLFPLRQISVGAKVLANFENRKSTCSSACKLGEKEQMPVFRFLKEPIIRYYGQTVYDSMEAVYDEFFSPT